MKLVKLMLVSALVLTLVSPQSFAQNNLRGAVFEFDPGPDKSSGWPDLFAETPNYRAIGKAIIGSSKEKFRYEFGPMWYRGRLEPNKVKVFVVGQEGAQDENISNRAFTGSTGTKMQNFLNHIGVTKNYLFMNTFVYTIFGQYTDFNLSPPATPADVAWIAQDLNSPIVQHRHKMFDYMWETNQDSLRLIIGVGRAGKDSVETWIRYRAQKLGLKPSKVCPYLENCDASQVFESDVRVIGVVHPGGASTLNGGSGQANNIVRDFSEKADLVAEWMQDDPQWLKPDNPKAKAPAFGSYRYKNAPVPHRDFPFGLIWTMGADGTASNRQDKVPKNAPGAGAYYSIQVQSANGCYNATVRVNGRCERYSENEDENLDIGREPISYKRPRDLANGISEMASGDVPWEPAKSKAGRRQFDPGPPSTEWAKLLTGSLSGYEWPEFSKLGVTSHSSFGIGSIYRGQLENAEVLVIADQESHDDMFTGRAWTGTGGQKLQTWLGLVGTSNYAVLRTLPVDTLDLTAAQRTALATNPQVVKVLDKVVEKVLDQGKTRSVVVIGTAAKAYVKASTTLSGTTVVELDHPAESGNIEDGSEVASWNKAINLVRAELGLNKSTVKYDGSLSVIARGDLPNQMRWWMGTSGSRAARAWNHGDIPGKEYDRKPRGFDPDYYKLYVPGWVFTTTNPPLTDAEKTALKTFKP